MARTDNNSSPDPDEKILAEVVHVLRRQGNLLKKQEKALRSMGTPEELPFADVRESVDRLYSSSRWKFANTWRRICRRFSGDGSQSVAYPPLEKALARLEKRVGILHNATKERDEPNLGDFVGVPEVEPVKGGPLVSVLMTTFNRRALVGRAIDSVIAQDYQNWELIIVDDGSTDGTGDLVRSLSDPRIRYTPVEHAGRSAALNAALEISSGELLAYLDSDNWWKPAFLSTLVGHLVHQPEFRAAFSGREMILACAEVEVSLGDRFEPYSRSLLENRNLIDLSGLVHYREDIVAIGGFDERLSRFVDWEMMLRLTQDKAPISIPDCLFCYEISPDNDQISYTENRIENEATVQETLAAKPLSLPAPCSTLTGGYALYSNMASLRADNRRPVSIVIPNWEVPQCLKVCIDALVKFCEGHDYEIIIVDNASSSPETERILGQIEAKGTATVVRNNSNLGFSYAINQGIKRAGAGRDIVLFNNDAIATDGWLDGLMVAREENPEAALIAPREVLLPRHQFAKTHVPACNADREVDAMLSSHHGNVLPSQANPSGYRDLKFAPFFCVYLPRWAVDEIGYLDHIKGRHYKSDRLYCEEIIRRGHRIVYTPHSKVYHLGQQATAVLREEAAAFETMFVRNEWGESELPATVE